MSSPTGTITEKYICQTRRRTGFRHGRSCNEQIFTLRNIIEQSSEYRKPLIINYVDVKKAFDIIYRLTLWNILKNIWHSTKV